MLLNYLTLAVRNLIKHKSNTFISMFGMLAGISAALVLLLYAKQELMFDTSHLKWKNIFCCLRGADDTERAFTIVAGVTIALALITTTLRIWRGANTICGFAEE